MIAIALLGFLAFMILVLCFCIFSSKYIFVDNRIESVFYPRDGFVVSEEMAIKLCCYYIESVYGLDLQESDLIVFYDKKTKAWLIKDNLELDELTFDRGLTMLIRKKDGKILMHSIY